MPDPLDREALAAVLHQARGDTDGTSCDYCRDGIDALLPLLTAAVDEARQADAATIAAMWGKLARVRALCEEQMTDGANADTLWPSDVLAALDGNAAPPAGPVITESTRVREDRDWQPTREGRGPLPYYSTQQPRGEFRSTEWGTPPQRLPGDTPR